jgi:hypothetical protein
MAEISRIATIPLRLTATPRGVFSRRSSRPRDDDLQGGPLDHHVAVTRSRSGAAARSEPGRGRIAAAHPATFPGDGDTSLMKTTCADPIVSLHRSYGANVTVADAVKSSTGVLILLPSQGTESLLHASK